MWNFLKKLSWIVFALLLYGTVGYFIAWPVMEYLFLQIIVPSLMHYPWLYPFYAMGVLWIVSKLQGQ